MASLLAHLPRRGREDRERTLSAGWLTAAATVAVNVCGLLGLTLAVVVVQTLDPSGGLPVSGSLALAGRLWLLAQGAGLELASGPLVLAPLGLTVGLAWALHRAGRWAAHGPDEPATSAVLRMTGVLVGAHTAVNLLLALPLDTETAGVDLLRTTAGVAVLALVAGGSGIARESGLAGRALDRLPAVTRPVLRGVLSGLLTALALCTAVVAVAVASDSAGYAALSGSLGGAAAGALGLLALSVLLLPNAAVAVLGLAAGPGFAVGSGTLVSVHGVALGPVPALPLLAGLPDTQAVPLIAFASQAIPALAGLMAGRTVGRRLGDGDGGSVVAGLLGVLTGMGVGLAGLVVVWAGAGSLGDGALAGIGAPPLATGIALAAQAGIAAAIAAAVARWRARG